MLEEMIKAVFNKQIAVKYPHLQHPAFMRAQVTAATPAGGWRRYNLRIFGKNGELDDSFPEIPNVYSKLYFEGGETVAIGLLYGELDPVIIGEVC